MMATETRTKSQLARELEQKAAEVRVLRTISAEITATFDLEALFATVLRTMDELFGFDHCLILLVDDSGEWLEVVSSRGYPEPGVGARVAVGSGLAGVVAKRRRIVRLGSLTQQRAYVSTIRRQLEQSGRMRDLDDVPSLPGLPNVESQVGIPLIVEGTLIGVFLVESETKRTFSEDEETLIAIVANHAASAIHNARLFRELAAAHENLRELNESLEDRVRERTDELQRAYRELRATQAQLLQAAKLAALGDLVAGLTHEINTPLGSIHANADVTRRAAVMVGEALEGEEAFLARHHKLRQALDALDVATSTTLTATERIAAIMNSLKTFARLDEAERKKANLHHGIESALTLLQHRLGERINVLRRYGPLPDLMCYPNRLNQVFMNVLVNAIQAIADRGTITITTRIDEGHAVLEFEDTGVGIERARLDRIFDPGFTTKGSGVGVGLGLATSYRIVEEHHGNIEVSSERGKGTTVRIRLPIDPS